MSHLLLLSAQHIPGKVIKINPWQHCAMVQCDVHCVWLSLPGFWCCFSPFRYYLHLTEQGLFSPHVTCCRKHHAPGDWHCGNGDTYWFWELSCSPYLNVSDSSITWLLEIHRWRPGSVDPSILRFPWHRSNNNLGMVWWHPSGIAQHLHRKKKKKQTLTEKGGFLLLQMDFFFVRNVSPVKLLSYVLQSTAIMSPTGLHSNNKHHVSSKHNGRQDGK